jgi:hypothetical protein
MIHRAALTDTMTHSLVSCATADLTDVEGRIGKLTSQIVPEVRVIEKFPAYSRIYSSFEEVPKM